MLYLQTSLVNINMSRLVIITISIFTLYSCVSQKKDISKKNQDNNTGVTGNVVIQHISAQPDGLHAYNNNSAIRSFIFQYTQKTLMKLDLETLEYTPALLDSMPKISKDGLKYTYKIKEGVTWDDGSPLTAKDVEHTVKILLCPLTNNTQIRGNYTDVIKSIELDPTDPLVFTMHAQKLHVDNKVIFTGIYLQQKNHWDPNGILEKISF